MNFIVCLPGKLSAKDKEKGLEVSPEKKERGKKKQSRRWMNLVGYTSS